MGAKGGVANEGNIEPPTQKPMNSGITTGRVAGCQLGDHPPKRLKRCGSAERHGMRPVEMGLPSSLSQV